MAYDVQSVRYTVTFRSDLMSPSSGTMIEVAGYPKTSVHSYQTTRSHTSEDINFNYSFVPNRIEQLYS